MLNFRLDLQRQLLKLDFPYNGYLLPFSNITQSYHLDVTAVNPSLMTLRMAGVSGSYTLTSFSRINYTMGRGSGLLGDTTGFTLYMHLSTVDYNGIESTFPYPTTEALRYVGGGGGDK